MKRIFIAAKITGNTEFRKLVTDLKKELGGTGIKWTDTGNIHLTLAFLGNTEESIIPTISKMLDEKCHGFGGFDFVIRGIGVFKSMKDPKVIWAGIDKPEKLSSLQVKIVNGLNETGIITEDRPFSPHITLGRIKHIQNVEVLKVLLLKYHSSDIQLVHVDEIILFESILHPQGPEYKPVSVHTLM